MPCCFSLVFFKDIRRSCLEEEDAMRQEWRLMFGIELPASIPFCVEVAPSVSSEESKLVPSCCLLSAAGVE